jgi:hypothetical protein
LKLEGDAIASPQPPVLQEAPEGPRLVKDLGEGVTLGLGQEGFLLRVLLAGGRKHLDDRAKLSEVYSFSGFLGIKLESGLLRRLLYRVAQRHPGTDFLP